MIGTRHLSRVRPALWSALILPSMLLCGAEPASALDDDYDWSTDFAGVGFDNIVYDAVEYAGDLVVGGRFLTHSGRSTPYVARWDGTSWNAMGNPGWVFTQSLVEYGGELYAHGFWGGSFVPRYFIKWNGTAWEIVTTFTNVGYLGIAHEMVVYDGKLVITGDVGLNGLFNLFAYDGTDFVSVGNGPDTTVYEMAVYEGELYAAGTFETLLDSTTVASGLARWDGIDWSPVEGRSTAGGPLVEGLRYGAGAGYGYSLTVHDGQLVVGGLFDHAGDLPVENLCAYDVSTQTWIDIGSSDDPVTELESYGGSLYASGELTSVGGVPVDGMARWDGTAWSAVGNFSTPPSELFAYGGSLLVAGSFRSVGSVQVENLAWWDGTQFSSRMDPGGLGLDGLVQDLEVHDGSLFAAGTFEFAGTALVNRVARWDGAAWHDLGGGANAGVRQLQTWGSDLVAVGDFTEIGGIPANFVARWDGAVWHAYGAGAPTAASAVCVHDGELHVGGGAFPDPSYVQRWDGTSWQEVPLPSTVSSVAALASDGSDLFLGASYFDFGSIFSYVGRYDGTSWLPLLSTAGLSVGNGVKRFETIGGELHMVGSFFYVENEYPYGGWTESRAARWDGSYLYKVEPIFLESTISGQELNVTYDIAEYDGKRFLGGGGNYGGGRIYSSDGIANNWQLVGNDVNSTVFAMASYQDRLFLGGRFNQVGTNTTGGTVSASIAALQHPPTSAPPSAPASGLVLEQNRPNPFNPVTTLRFTVPRDAELVTLSVHDARGRLVRLLYSGPHFAGPGAIRWDGTDDGGARVSSGTYYCRLIVGSEQVARKMVLLK